MNLFHFSTGRAAGYGVCYGIVMNGLVFRVMMDGLVFRIMMNGLVFRIMMDSLVLGIIIDSVTKYAKIIVPASVSIQGAVLRLTGCFPCVGHIKAVPHPFGTRCSRAAVQHVSFPVDDLSVLPHQGV